MTSSFHRSLKKDRVQALANIQICFPRIARHSRQSDIQLSSKQKNAGGLLFYDLS